VSRSDIGDETNELQTPPTDDELTSLILELEPFINTPANSLPSNMVANEQNGKGMLTEDNANVETEITDNDNDVTAMLSAFNTGDISSKKRSDRSPIKITSFDQNDVACITSYALSTQETANTVPLMVSSDSDIQSPVIITQQSSVSVNNASPIILDSIVSPVSSYNQNATLNVPVTQFAVVQMPMETSNLCYYYNGNNIGFNFQPGPITSEVLSSMPVDSVRNITLPITDATPGVVYQPQDVVEPVSSTVASQGVCPSSSAKPATLKRKAKSLDEQDGNDPSKTKKWRIDKMGKINDKWTEINAEVQEVENINKDITGKVAVFHHKNPSYGRDPCLEYGLHTYIIDLEKECNERLKALKEDKPRDSVKRKATHLKDLNELLKDFKKIKEKKGHLTCMLDKKISGA